jgi:adenosylcobinamide-phosphate synthase
VVTLTPRAAAVAAGLVVDRLAGEPPAGIHPVARFGSAMDRVERLAYSDSRLRGAAYTAAGVAIAASAGAALSFARRARPSEAVAAATAVTVAGKALADAALAVAGLLAAGDLAGARVSLPSLVGRDPACLGEKEIARAVLESVAENTVDAVVAPAFWAVAGGAPAAFAYRAVNTMDAVVGHRSPRYERFGWASARLDDAAGWVPARVTAALVAAVRPRAAGAVWRAVRSQSRAHPSPNAGVAEAAFAAALGISVGGANVYGGRVDHRPDLGFGPPASPPDIARAVRLSRDVTAVLGGLLAAPVVVRRCRYRRRPAG